MACFVAPETTAIVLTVVRKKFDPRLHIEWLLTLLWGGVAWLIPEHIYHGEVVWHPPFFTAGLHHLVPEILRVGVPMTLVAVGIWASLLAAELVSKRLSSRLNPVSLAILGAVVMVLVDKVIV